MKLMNKIAYLLNQSTFMQVQNYIHKKILVVLKFVRKNDSIIDLGCGNREDNLATRILTSKFPNYLGVDSDPQISSSKIIKSDIETFKINKKFDVVLCLDVIEHFKNPNVVVDKISQLCKKRAIVATPIISNKKVRLIGNLLRSTFGFELLSKHYWEFFEYEILQLFDNGKFDLKKIIYLDTPIPLIHPLLAKFKLIRQGCFIFDVKS